MTSFLSCKHSLRKSGRACRNIGKHKTVNPNRTVSLSEFSIYTDSRSPSLGVAEARTSKLNVGALKCQNPFFFLRILFMHYRDTKTAKSRVGRIDTYFFPLINQNRQYLKCPFLGSSPNLS